MRDFNRGVTIDSSKLNLKNCVTDFKARLGSIDISVYMEEGNHAVFNKKKNSRLEFLSRTNLPLDSKVVKL